MMKIENKDFWEKQEVILTQDTPVPNSSDFEIYLYTKVLNHFKNGNQKLKSKTFGCGTGREIPEILKYTKFDYVLASDISENMISICNKNLKNWGVDNRVDTMVCNASDYKGSDNSFQMVTIMNSMLTYVKDRNERYAIFKSSHQILTDDGCIIGVVHNQEGAPLKTLYFLIRRIFSVFLRGEVGHRKTGFKGFKVEGYYFSKSDLIKHLRDNGFKNIEVQSISEFYKSNGFGYDKWNGYNNLLFFATKS